MDYFWTNERTELDGRKSINVIPWAEEDYKQAIVDIESKITRRRLREALLSPEGEMWLSDREGEIAQLREAINNL